MSAITVPDTLRHARITGVGAYRPVAVVPNSEIIGPIDSSDQWIKERSGIESRHRAGEGESVVEMSVQAAKGAMEQAGVGAEQLGGVIVATVTHPYQTPGAAPEVAARLGSGAAAFDISAACAGYCYAISIASDMVRVGTADHVLVVGVERMLDFTDPEDRGSAFIFGDGAGAVVVSPSNTPGIGPTVWGSDGDKRQLIAQRDSWNDLHTDRGLRWPAIVMEGPSVFRWAVWSMVKEAQRALDAAGVRAEDLAAFIPHQANVRIIDQMAKTLGLPEGLPVARDIRTTANTSAASVPLAMERMLREGEVASGGLALQIGFGAGLVWAAQVVTLP
ncbi:beta-ketoacyl-ACP synthase III [Janibacter corallicola]|uniref:beta-ketoacyl-ACP synthase III n=1 Tax=Janibacter corallicola TaxID=415212 RepID=UPI0008299D36|nr:beta-ketoacyl-ACP synthase III [Janibacter corallicola]